MKLDSMSKYDQTVFALSVGQHPAPRLTAQVYTYTYNIPCGDSFSARLLSMQSLHNALVYSSE